MYAISKAPIAVAPLTTLQLQAMTAVIVPPFLASPQVHLFVSSTSPPNPGSVLADFTEAVFPGYAALAATLNPAIVNLANSQGLGLIASVSFVASAAPATPQLILGYFVQNAGAGPNLLYVESFPAPIPIVAGGDYLNLDLIFPLPFQTLTGQ